MARIIAAAETRLRQLCCLGLAREAVIPALLEELRTIVPNVSSLAFFIEDEKLVGGYTDNPEAVHTGPLYMSEFHGRRGRELGGAFPDSVRFQRGVHDQADALRAINVDMPTFQRSEFYNLIYRPQRVHWFMRLMVRNHDGRGPALGSFTLYRGPRDPAWNAEEKRRLESLQPFLALALRKQSESDAPLADTSRQGLIIATADGLPLHLSSEGRRLLDLVVNPTRTPSAHFASNELPLFLQRICRSVPRVFDGDASPEAPSHYHRNAWGGFTFVAHRLGDERSNDNLVGITITHSEPLPVQLLRSIREMPLSPRQGEVCFLMAQGVSNEAIAERLGISRHTAIAHGRWIYQKLDVNNRAELVARLLTRRADPRRLQ